MTTKRFSFAQPLWLGEVDSTNTYLKAEVAAGRAVTGQIVSAHRQTTARGRMGNSWCPAQGDIAFSFLWRGMAAPLAAGALPMACALGVRDFLALPPWRITAQCKWPNDVLVSDKKICGILTEGSFGTDREIELVVGIGVNIRACPERDKEVGKKTATLEELFDGTVGTAEELLPGLLSCLEERINEWMRGGTATVVESLQKCQWGVGKAVRARTKEGVVEGVVYGLGDEAELLLKTDGGILSIASVNALEQGWE